MAGPALNYYYGIARGQLDGVGDYVVVDTASGGTAADVELRVQMNNGTNPTSITLLEVCEFLETFKHYLENLGLESLPGTDIPNQTYTNL